MNLPHPVPRLLLLTETYWPEIGGGERQARSLAEAFATLGREITILTRRSRHGLARREQDGPAQVLRLPPTGPGRWRKWLLALPTFLALCRRRRQYDAVLVSGFRILGLAALMARVWTRRPTVLKADSRGELSGEYFRDGLESLGLTPEAWPVSWALRLRNTVLRRADAYVALSEEMAKEFLDHGIPAERVHRIPNGVDTAVFRPATPDERARIRQHLGLGSRPVAVYTGRLVSYKGLPSLLRAWRSVADAVLVLVGEGGADLHSCESELRAFVGEHGLRERVQFAGPTERVEEWLRAADLFVFPTENEAFGLSLAEAMACGLPSVTTQVGGLRDFVVDGGNALVVQPGDDAALGSGIARLIGDAECRAELGMQARRTAEERFSLPVVARAYAALVDELCDPVRRVPA
jgi:glycosyltransferase involved in cell wall biosynthesis